MATQKYNKSEIMKDAWRLFRLYRKFSWSFGKCLSIAWDNAKIEIKIMRPKPRDWQRKKLNASSIASMLSYLMSVWLAFTVTGFIRVIDNYTLII